MMTPKEPTWDFVGPGGTAWVDPPLFDELQAAPYLGAIGTTLRDHLDAYHRVPKTSQTDLPERVERLAALAAWLQAPSCDSRLLPLVQGIGTLAAAKAEHLSALVRIYAECWHEEARLSAYHRDTSGCTDHRFSPIVLTNRRYFWPEYGTYWGDYWMETLDPCHRHLPHMHLLWQRLQRTVPGGLPHYLLWLEENHAIAHPSWMRFLSSAEQQEKRILVDQGRLTNLRGRPLHCTDSQHFFFVVDLAGTLFATRTDPHLCHSSFTRGGPVLASGGLQAREGRLIHLKFESGHYLASPAEWWQALQILLEAGIYLDEGLRVTVFDRYRYVSRVIQSEALTSRSSFLRSLGMTTDQGLLEAGCR